MPSNESTPEPRASALGAISSRVVLAWGWLRRLIALIAGATGALAMPPLGLWPALLIPMMVAVWLIDGSVDRGEGGVSRWAPIRAAFGAGWWWGFGYFVAGLWWLGAAFLVDAEHFAWALPLGVLGLPAALAFFPAVGFAISRAIWPSGGTRALALAFGIGLSEWLRAVIFTGFPWNDWGMALGQNLVLSQCAALCGLHGLTLAAAAIFAAPATLADAPRRIWPSAVAVLALACVAGYGLVRLDEPSPPEQPRARLRLMQPNISQGRDFAPEKGAEILGKYLQLSDRATSPDRTGIADVTHLFWPESAFPFILSREAGALARITDFLRGGAVLTTGAARMEENKRGGGRARYFNAIQTLDHTGLLAERYDKHHLVPFGEYMPFQSLLERAGVTQFVQFPGGFERGSGSGVIRLPGLPDAIALVCYEAIFTNEWGRYRDGENRRAAWLLNLTDDAWFGVTPGPYQHFTQARLRAVEWGLPMVRVANSGISAFIDPYGRVLSATPLGVEAVLDGGLPGPLAPTWQSRWGSLTAALMAALFALVSLATRSRPGR